MPIRIICDDYCQLCNRFWSYLDSIGWAIKNNGHVYSLFWDENIKDFDALRYSKYISFPSLDIYAVNKGIKLWGWNLSKFLYARIIDSPIAHRFYKSRISRNLGFIEGWPTRYNTDNIPNRSIIKQLFLPNKTFRDKVDPFFEKIKKEGYFVVGIHIRRGDYATWEGGKWYYSHEQYLGFMEQIKDTYKDRRICFFLASNEKVPPIITERFKCINIPGANAATDLYALTLCDRLVGPPSTFSRWASFVSNIPLYFIFNPETPIHSDNQFCPIADHFHFEDGREIPI